MIKKIVISLLAIFSVSSLWVYNASAQVKKLKTIIVDAGHGGTDAGAVGVYENSLNSKEKDVTLAISKKLVVELKKRLPDVKVVPTRTTDIYQNPREKAEIANKNMGDLFLCIHADSGPVKNATREAGTKEVTKYKITYTGKGKHKVKHSEPYTVTVPIYEHYKKPLDRKGTSVWIFAAHKTSDKMKAIMEGGEDFEIETDDKDTISKPFDFNSRDGRLIASLYASRFQERSDKLGMLVNNEIEATGRAALGVSQRQKGIWVLQATNMPAILIETGFINNEEDEKYINSEAGQQELAEAIAKAVVSYKNQIENIQGANTKPKEQPKETKPTVTAPYESRNIKDIKTIQVKSNKVKVAIYDDGEIDNDIVSVYFNKKLVVDKKSLSTTPVILELDLENAKQNELVMFAENVGTIPPNTALMIITDGSTRNEVRLSADLKNNASVRFEIKK